MISDEEIDEALLANITEIWRKVARVVGTTMIQINRNERKGKDDLYFAKRVAILVEKGLIEHNGDLNQMGLCEIRLTELKANRA
jgi:Protein of unknown function